ncbi:MAG: hypothetical protein MJ187_02030 [Alphaproteobacteria bacterium]|nr:hypothetical protein [Alphaproteobacteria bacterium]
MKNTEKSNNFNLKNWIFKYPVQYMLYTLGFELIVFAIALLLQHTLYNGAPNPLMAIILVTLPFIVSAIIMIKKYPRDNFNQYQFVGLCNAITFVGGGFLILSAMVSAITQQISQTVAIIGIVIFSLLALYAVGLSLCDFYIKFRRIRSFNIPTWKILCTWPFAYSMMWIPGYMTSDKNNKSDITKNNWYAKFTRHIIGDKLALIAVLLLSFGLSLDFWTVLIQGTILIGWYLIRREKFKSDFSGKFALCAVIVNFAMIVIAIFALSRIIQMDNNINTGVDNTEIEQAIKSALHGAQEASVQ